MPGLGETSSTWTMCEEEPSASSSHLASCRMSCTVQDIQHLPHPISTIGCALLFLSPPPSSPSISLHTLLFSPPGLRSSWGRAAEPWDSPRLNRPVNDKGPSAAAHTNPNLYASAAAHASSLSLFPLDARQAETREQPFWNCCLEPCVMEELHPGQRQNPGGGKRRFVPAARP